MPAKQNKNKPDKLAAAWLLSRPIMNKKPRPSPNLDAPTRVFLGLLQEAVKTRKYPQQSYYQVHNLLNHMADHEADLQADTLRRIEVLERKLGIK